MTFSPTQAEWPLAVHEARQSPVPPDGVAAGLPRLRGARQRPRPTYPD